MKEAPGKANNTVVQAYYKDSGHPEIKHDSVPWCAAFVGAMLKRAGLKHSGSLLARSYLSWGKKLAQPKRGAIVVLARGNSSWQGHVAFFECEDKGRIVCLGGNQSDRVTLASIQNRACSATGGPPRRLPDHIACNLPRERTLP